MKLAVTGGSGQLGTHVLRKLARDREVTEIVSLDLRPPAVASPKVRAVTADVRDRFIDAHLKGCDALVHLAFVVTRHLPRPTFDAINVGGSQNVFRAAAAAGISRIVYLSSVAAYGVVPGHPEPIVEETPRVHQRDFPYASAKYEVEAFLDTFEAERPHIAIARLRPSILIGVHMEHSLGRAMQRRRLFHVGDGAPAPVVWDEDVADAVVTALKQSARGAFNLSADQPLTIPEMARAAGFDVVRVPRWVAKAAARAAVVGGRLGLLDADDPAWLDQIGVRMIPSSERARTVLGWKPSAPTAADVMRRYAEEAPTRPDRRIERFFKLAGLGGRVRKLPPDMARSRARVHLRLAGPAGGDWGLLLEDGRFCVTRGVPRPPTTVLTIRAERFLDALAGRADVTSMLLTGALATEGEPTGAMVLHSLITQWRQTVAGAKAPRWIKRLASSLVTAEETR